MKVTKERAIKFVKKEVGDCYPTNPPYVFKESIIETNFCWIIYYQSKKCVLENDESKRYFGNSPYMIDKFDGEVCQIGFTFRPICRDIEYLIFKRKKGV